MGLLLLELAYSQRVDKEHILEQINPRQPSKHSVPDAAHMAPGKEHK